MQDLQAVNAAVHARAPNVPNPHTILSQVPPGSKWFSVVDLANAFFSIPVDPDSQYWFAAFFEAADGEPHDCVAVITETCSPRPDLQETPLINPELELFVDGSASRDPATGECQSG
ncbi:uncharacterized protein LOC122869991 isoform X4 [Siniperca chuatsi]|uniref:uncharacterized protein LOC122869991 isoform X4 n=1 Tax=Siniperca chuatsi TaxID=119488 RepID=UPI001CE13A0A|nr:uncharacterized protein LOC122869991 isoform X4 [Siniperca chuatsi]